MMIEELFKNTLKKHSLYETPERVRIFQELKDQKSPYTIQDIINLTKAQLNPTTVYRNIDLFEQIGVIVRVYTGWKYKIELSDKFSPHHHHMTCENCGSTIAFEEPDSLLFELSKLERKFKFKSRTHSLELIGLCLNCC